MTVKRAACLTAPAKPRQTTRTVSLPDRSEHAVRVCGNIAETLKTRFVSQVAAKKTREDPISVHEPLAS